MASPGGHSFPTKTQAPHRWLPFAICLFLGLAVWVVFGQTLHHKFVNYDDDFYVYENWVVAQGISLKGIDWAFNHVVLYNWHPLTMITHMLDCQMYGLQAGGHHLTSVLLHTASAMLLFLLLRNLTGALWRSAFVAAVFAIHPLRVESVAWVAERKDVLSGLFFMLTLWSYERYASRPFSLGRYLSVVFLFALGLLSKPMVVTLPFVLLLLDYWPLKRFAKSAGWREWFGIPRRLLLEKIPLLLMAVAGCVITLVTQRGAIPTNEQFPFLMRASNALMAYAAYVGQMFFPTRLAPFYPRLTSVAPGWESLLELVFLVAISGGVFFWRKSRPALLVGWFWYLGMLVPVIGLVQVGMQAHADRYTYLPQIGLFVMIVWLVADLSAGWRYRRLVLGGIMVTVITALMVVSSLQVVYWRDSESLWTHTLDCTPENSTAHVNLGVALAGQGKLAVAIQHYERALQLNPDSVAAHGSLGLALARQGKLAEAVQHYERTLQLDPDNVPAHNNLGIALVRQGRLAEAIQHFNRTLQLNPNHLGARNNLALALSMQEKPTVGGGQGFQ